MYQKIKIHDKHFSVFIKNTKILKEIKRIASELNARLKDNDVIFLIALNGSFMFASELLKHIDIICEISFIKVSSYSGKNTTGNVKNVIGINENLKNKTVVIIEDIVDTGITAEFLMNEISKYEPNDVILTTLFFKPSCFKKNVKIDYVGMEIPDDFIIGFGLDYNGLGRNLNDIYKLTD